MTDYYQLKIIKNWCINFLAKDWFLFAWLLFLTLLSLVPGDKLPVLNWNFLSPDTIAHFVFYGLLTFSGVLNLVQKKVNLSKGVLYSIMTLTTIAYGWCIELIQEWLITNRFFSWKDIIANSVGALIGGAFALVMCRK